MSPRPFIVPAIAVTTLSTAAARGVGTYAPVVAVGDPTPAGPVVELNGRAVLNAGGLVAFDGRIGVQGQPWDIAVADPAGGNVALAFEPGAAMPDGSGTLTTVGGGSGSLGPALDDDGRVLVDAAFRTDAGASGTAILVNDRPGQAGEPRVLARTGGLAPTGEVFGGVRGLRVDRNGTGLFTAAIGNNSGLVRFDLDAPDDGLSIVARVNGPVPGGGTFGPINDHAVGEAGQALFTADVVPTGGGAFRSLVLAPADGPTRRVARVGDDAPGGGIFDGLAQVRDVPPAPNAAGDVLFYAQTDDGHDGLFLDRGGALESVVRLGDDAPDGTGVFDAGFFAASFLDATLDADGRVAFLGHTQSPGTLGTRGVYRHDESGLTAVARSNVPTAAQGAWAFETISRVTAGATGRLAFEAVLRGNGFGPGPEALFYFDDRLGVVPIVIAREASPLGDLTGANVGAPPWFGPGRRSVGDDGQVVFTYRTNLGGRGIARWTPPSLDDLLPGDANFDGRVNLADFTLLAGNFGLDDAYWSTADFTGDGRVNLADFTVLADHFGDATAGEMAVMAAWRASVPEPAAAAALLLAGGLAARRRGR